MKSHYDKTGISAVVITTATLSKMKGIYIMFYFTVSTEYNANDLIEKLIEESENNQVIILLELSQEYSLESDILDLVDVNIGENVELFEIIEDIENNLNEYIQCLLENIDENDKEDLLESLKDLK